MTTDPTSPVDELVEAIVSLGARADPARRVQSGARSAAGRWRGDLARGPGPPTDESVREGGLAPVPGERFVMSTAAGPFPMETTYTWSDAPGGSTKMTLRNRGEPAGFAKVAAPVIERAMRGANRKDLARLKQILERA